MLEIKIKEQKCFLFVKEKTRGTFYEPPISLMVYYWSWCSIRQHTDTDKSSIGTHVHVV